MQQVGLTKTSHTHKSSTGVSGKVDKACQESFFNQDWGDVVEDDWKLGAVDDEGDPTEEGVHKGLAEALGIKVPKPKEKPKKEDVWETTSKITAADSHQDILDKVWKFKAELEKDISQLGSKEYEAKKAGLDDKELLKKKKAVMPKLQASGVLNTLWAGQPLSISCLTLFGLDSPSVHVCMFVLNVPGMPSRMPSPP